ncbi:MAG: ribosomal protein S5-alanine N-acetyltransferase [Candidatus Elarobacter sp.]
MSVALETGRLSLREPADADAPLLLDYYRRNAARLAAWEPAWEEDVAQQLRWIAWRRGESATEHGRSFLAYDRAEPAALVAIVNLYDIVRGQAHSAMLGYSIDGAYEGRGYAREAVEAVILYAFGTLNLHRLTANYQPANARSAALLERLGFAVEGHGRELVYLRGTWRDHVLTALLNPLWQPPAP